MKFLKCFFSHVVHCWCSAPYFFSPTDVYAGQPREALSSIMPIILGGRSVVAEPLINIFILVFCLPCPVVGTYRSLQLAVLHNERILQDKRNLITVSLFSLFFVCVLYIYRCFAVLKIIELLRERIINNYVGFETRLRTNSPKNFSGHQIVKKIKVSKTAGHNAIIKSQNEGIFKDKK